MKNMYFVLIVVALAANSVFAGINFTERYTDENGNNPYRYINSHYSVWGWSGHAMRVIPEADGSYRVELIHNAPGTPLAAVPVHIEKGQTVKIGLSEYQQQYDLDATENGWHKAQYQDITIWHNEYTLSLSQDGKNLTITKKMVITIPDEYNRNDHGSTRSWTSTFIL